VGSSQTPSRSNCFLNTMLADSIDFVTEQIAALLKQGRSKDQAVEAVARAPLKQHLRVVFNGNGYSEEWVHEAAKRGLPNLRNTPAALATFLQDKNVKLFQQQKVLSKVELEARSNVWLEDYNKKVIIEGKTLSGLILNEIVPAAIEYQTSLAKSIAAVKEAKSNGSTTNQSELLAKLTSTIDAAVNGASKVGQAIEQAHHQSGLSAEGVYLRDNLLPAMLTARQACDQLESLVPGEDWPLPTYNQMLFHSPH